MDFKGTTINGNPAADWFGIQAEAANHRTFLIKVLDWSEGKENSLKQMAWINGVLIPYLSNKTGDSINWWKTRLKIQCGRDLFDFEKIIVNKDEEPIWIISHENELTIKQGSAWITNILDFLPTIGHSEVTPPDPEWNKRKEINYEF